MTPGVAGPAVGAATLLPGALVQPFTVCVTEYVPGMDTVMDVVVAPLLHNNVPEVPVAVKNELPQLFVTFTVGAAGIEFTVNVAAFEFALPAVLVQTARYCLLLSAIATVNDNVAVVAPVIFVHVVPLVLDCHCTVGAGLPFADELKLTLEPPHFVCDDG